MKKGFTLIELVVVVAVLAVLMITLTGVLINSFRAKNRVDVGDRLEQNGNYALMEIKNNFLKASGVGISCPSDVGTSIAFVNREDGQPIVLSCENDKISSGSAVLTSSLVAKIDCSNFVECDCSNFVKCVSSSDGPVVAADFKFVLSTGVTEAGIANFVSRTFEQKVVVRN